MIGTLSMRSQLDKSADFREEIYFSFGSGFEFKCIGGFNNDAIPITFVASAM